MKEIIIIDDTKILMFGDYVSVIQYVDEIKIKKPDGVLIRHVPSSEPFISFPWIRKNDEGEQWIDEDNTISGGLTIKAAETLIKELMLAVDYLKKQGG